MITPLQQYIVTRAQAYLGKTEITGNAGFHDPVFEQRMRAIGWTPPEPWCAALLKLIYLESITALDPSAIHLIHQYFSLSAGETYHNCAESPEYHVTQTPDIGYAVIWLEGSGPSGHAGIVTGLIPGGFTSIEGNTTDPAHLIPGMSPREGYIVAQHTHMLGNPYNPASLNIKGFVSPNRIA